MSSLGSTGTTSGWVLAHALAGLIQTEEESWQWAGRLTSFLWILDKRREGPPVTHRLWDLRDTPQRQCRCLHIEEETQIKRDRVLGWSSSVPYCYQVWLLVPRFWDLLEYDPILSGLYSPYVPCLCSTYLPIGPQTSTIPPSWLSQTLFYCFYPFGKSFPTLLIIQCWRPVKSPLLHEASFDYSGTWLSQPSLNFIYNLSCTLSSIS